MTSDSLLKLSRIVHLAFSLREDETDWLWKTGDDTSKLIMWIQVASVDGLGMGEEDSEVFVELQHRGTKRRTHSAKVQASHSINFDAINLQDDTEFPESIGRFRMESGKLKAFFSESLQVAVFQKAADERPPKLVGKGSIDLSTIRDFAEDVKTWLAEVKSETADPLLHSHVVENIIHLVRDGKGNKKKIRTCSVKLRIGVELSRGGPMQVRIVYMSLLLVPSVALKCAILQNRVNLLYALVRSLALASMVCRLVSLMLFMFSCSEILFSLSVSSFFFPMDFAPLTHELYRSRAIVQVSPSVASKWNPSVRGQFELMLMLWDSERALFGLCYFQ